VLKEKATYHKAASAIYTFDRHPLSVLYPKSSPPLLMSTDQKIDALSKCGINYIILNSFDKKVASTDAKEFLNEMLFKKYHIKAIVVGFNFTFGYKGHGNVELLQAEGAKNGIDVTIVESIKINGITVSSSLIRHLIIKGCVEEAAVYLGRPFALNGIISSGHRVSYKIGFPTANLLPDDNIVIPNRGVYATYVSINGENKLRQAVTNIGFRPTFNDNHISIESHLLDYNGELYGKKAEIQFISRLRDEMRFSSPDDLAAQIRKDIEKAREILTKSE